MTLTPDDEPRFARALEELGVTSQAIHEIRSSPLPIAERLLKELKERAHKAYRRLAFELHPDRNAGDATKTERFTFLSHVAKHIEALRVQPPPVTFVHVVFTGPVSHSSGNTTSTTINFTNVQSARRVVTMRPF